MTTVAIEPLTAQVPAFQTLKTPAAKAPSFDFDAGLKEIATRTEAPPVEKEPKVEEPTPEPEVEELPEIEIEKKPDPKDEEPKFESPLGDVDVEEKKPQPKPEPQEEEAMPQLPQARKKQEEAFAAKERDLRAAKRLLKDKEEALEAANKRVATEPVNIQDSAEYKEAQQKLQAYEEKLTAREKAIEDYRKRESIWNLKESEDYKKSVMEPWQAIQVEIADVASTGTISDKDIFTLAQLPPLEQKAQLRALREGMDAHDYTSLVNILPKIKEVTTRAQSLETQATEHQELIKSERDRQVKEAQQRYAGDLTKERKVCRPEFDEKFIPNHKDPEVQRSIQQANEFIDNTNWYDVPADKQARILEVAGKANLAIQLMESQHRQEKEALQKEIDDLKKEKEESEKAIKKLSKATPAAGGNSNARPAAEELTVDAKNFSTKTAAEWLE